jgi:hypothetical protein
MRENIGGLHGYDPNFPDPLMERLTTPAPNIFCILRAAITHGLPVIDLRLICIAPEDYAKEIEPEAAGPSESDLKVSQAGLDVLAEKL